MDHRVGAGPDVDMSAPPNFAPATEPDGKQCNVIPQEHDADADACTLLVKGLGAVADCARLVHAYFAPAFTIRGAPERAGDDLKLVFGRADDLRGAVAFVPPSGRIKIEGHDAQLVPLVDPSVMDVVSSAA